MITKDSIIKALHNSTLIAELREAEIETLFGLPTIRHYKAGDVTPIVWRATRAQKTRK